MHSKYLQITEELVDPGVGYSPYSDDRDDRRIF